MAILVQRVSGAVYDDRYFPHIAGVGLSFNPYVWNSEIDPEAGMVRLVFGLGTRAVDRVDDDYTRIVALNAPLRRPEATSQDVRRFSQKKGDILDLARNRLTSRPFQDIVDGLEGFPLHIFASRDLELERRMRDAGREVPFSWMLTYDELLSQGSFVSDMREMMRLLEDAYQHPVDIEFTANFRDLEDYRINLLQCRPFQTKGSALTAGMPCTAPLERTIVASSGPVIGSNRVATVDRIIYVAPEVYGKMRMSDRYAVARLIGKLTHLKDLGPKPTILLLGPGRWATADPALGVPVMFSEISTASILCEVVAMHEGLVPEASLGTHFFNDLVEFDMLYCAVYPQREGNYLDREFFLSNENRLPSLLPEAEAMASAVKVIDGGGSGPRVLASSDVLRQRFTCYLDMPEECDED
jgi:hypothetical protein